MFIKSAAARDPLTEDPSLVYDALSDALLEATSLFARLQLLAGLHDRTSGFYTHPLGQALGSSAVDLALRRLHNEVFRTWLGMPLRRQAADLAIFRANSKGRLSMREVESIARNFVPQEVHRAERQLFLADLLVLGQMEAQA